MNRDDLSLILEKALARASSLFGFELKPHLSHQAASIDVLDLAIRDLMSREPDIYFLQIGAHDGLSYDPIHEYVRKYHWRGLLVEPQPAIFQKLTQNYAGEKQLAFENSAIAPKDGTLELHCFHNANAEDHASMLTSTRRHYLSLNGDGHRGIVKTITVPALSLASLLAKHQVERVNLLQIDTEGFDFEIIKMIDFARIKPEIIHYENNFLNRRQKSECSRLLGEQGYALLNLGIDTIAYRQPVREAFAERTPWSKIAPV
jgi:FkbM family methyltransferase